MEGNKRRLHLSYDEMRSLLDQEAFDKYSYSYLHVYAVFTPTGGYFQVETFDGAALAILSNVDKLAEYFRHNGR